MARATRNTRSSSQAKRAIDARLMTILLVCAHLASGTGCHVLRIPSYRADAGCGDSGAGYHGGDVYPAADMECPPTVLPPLPGWLAAWHEKKKTPQPPDYPRFQPLPTRPMFTPPKTQAGLGVGSAVNYGHWPSAENGGMQSDALPHTGSLGGYDVGDYTAEFPVPTRF